VTVSDGAKLLYPSQGQQATVDNSAEKKKKKRKKVAAPCRRLPGRVLDSPVVISAERPPWVDF